MGEDDHTMNPSMRVTFHSNDQRVKNNTLLDNSTNRERERESVRVRESEATTTKDKISLAPKHGVTFARQK